MNSDIHEDGSESTFAFSTAKHRLAVRIPGVSLQHSADISLQMMPGVYYQYTGRIRASAHKASFLLHHSILSLAAQPALPSTGGISNSAHPHSPWQIPNSFSCHSQVDGGEGTHRFLGLNIWIPLWVWWEGTQANTDEKVSQRFFQAIPGAALLIKPLVQPHVYEK